MNFRPIIFLLIFLQVINCSCKCSKPNIIHIDFCDFEDSVAGRGDKAGKTLQLKSLNYIVDATHSACWADSILLPFVKTDSFIQEEMNKKYYHLTITFYKRSSDTKILMKEHSSRLLNLCNDDIVVEYQWIEGKLLEPLYYHNGVIEGAKDIQLLDSNRNKIK